MKHRWVLTLAVLVSLSLLACHPQTTNMATTETTQAEAN